jgi:glycerol-3-phosphate O-acyltransferase/dihydroxyacetone phosphate acyltransferase
MLYFIIQALLKGTVKVFFKNIQFHNKKAIPANGPLIILANHPSTFMDPIVIASLVNRKVYFLGKGELFKGFLAKFILNSLHVIPVYRAQDDPTQLNKNTDTFRKCYEHLEQGHAIIIFPEGVSVTERKLKPIKGGAAHIALGAEGKNNFTLGVKVVNIGLNYENQHRFNQDLFINTADAIEIKDYQTTYETDKLKAIKTLTDNIKNQLESLVISIKDRQADEFVKNIEQLYLSQLVTESQAETTEAEKEFLFTKNIAKTVNYYAETNPDLYNNMRIRVHNYLQNINHLQLNDDAIKNKQNTSILGALVKLMIGFPVYIYGLINNVLAYEIPSWLATKIVKSRDYKGAIGMVLGMFSFIVFYYFQISFFYQFTQHQFYTLLYGLSLPFTGFFAYYYWQYFIKIKGNWQYLKLAKNKSKLIENLQHERAAIMLEFEKAKAVFFEQFPE